MHPRGFLAAVAAVLTGRRLGCLVQMPQIEWRVFEVDRAASTVTCRPEGLDALPRQRRLVNGLWAIRRDAAWPS